MKVFLKIDESITNCGLIHQRTGSGVKGRCAIATCLGGGSLSNKKALNDLEVPYCTTHLEKGIRKRCKL